MLLLLGCAPASLLLAPPPDVDNEGALHDLAPSTVAGNLRVAADGSGDFTTISAAIEAAARGATVSVAPGTYRERIDFGGRSVRVESTDGPEVTFLDAQGDGPNIVAENGEGDATAIVGFTLVDGRDDAGAVARVELASLHLEDVVVEGAWGGMLIGLSSGDLEMVDVDFGDATPTARGTVVYSSRGAVVADGVRFSCGSGTYGYYLGHGSAFIDHSEVDCGGSYAQAWEHTTGNVFRSRLAGDITVVAEDDHYTDAVRLENNLILGNISATYGTLVVRNSVLRGGGVNLSMTYTDTVIENSVFEDAPCAFSSDSVDFSFRYNDVWNVGATSCTGDERLGMDGNIGVNPQFTDEDAGDYTLRASSPLIDAGNEDPAQNDLDGTRNDIGLYGGLRTIAGGY